jgi:hypothetical protein
VLWPILLLARLSRRSLPFRCLGAAARCSSAPGSDSHPPSGIPAHVATASSNLAATAPLPEPSGGGRGRGGHGRRRGRRQRVCTSLYTCQCALTILQRPRVMAHFEAAVSGTRGRSCPLAPLEAMFVGAAPFALSWTRHTPPPPWPARWDPITSAQAFNNMRVTPPIRTEWIADSRASFHPWVLSSCHLRRVGSRSFSSSRCPCCSLDHP